MGGPGGAFSDPKVLVLLPAFPAPVFLRVRGIPSPLATRRFAIIFMSIFHIFIFIFLIVFLHARSRPGRLSGEFSQWISPQQGEALLFPSVRIMVLVSFSTMRALEMYFGTVHFRKTLCRLFFGEALSFFLWAY